MTQNHERTELTTKGWLPEYKGNSLNQWETLGVYLLRTRKNNGILIFVTGNLYYSYASTETIIILYNSVKTCPT